MHTAVASKCMAFGMILFLLAAGMGTSGAWSHRSTNEPVEQTIDDAVARAVAEGFLARHSRASWTIETVSRIASHEHTLAYLVSLNPQGYIAVSAHRELPPIVAYSFTSPAPVTDDTPFLELLRADLSTRLEHLDRLPSHIVEQRHADWADIDNSAAVASFEQWPPEGSTSTGGWVETTWSQDAPYNQYCPLDTNAGERSVAGCPAVTMAQILTYHRTVGSARFNDSDDYLHNYNGLRYTIDDDHETYDFPSFPTLNDRLIDAAARFEAGESLTEQDMAALIFACGVAAEQVYSAAGSGTFGVGQADQAYQRFSIPHTLKQDGDVYRRLAMNMIHGLPAHLAVVNEDWTAGHNLVVDGYNTDDYFHLNYGWGGSYDGWYLLPQEMRFDLTVLEGIVLDILYAPEDADVYCPGSLHWMDIEPGAAVQGSIPVANVGAANSSLHWQIVEHPDWGAWTFEPSEGTLRAGESSSIAVTVTGPERSLRNYTGHVKIVNVDDPDDCSIVQVSLATPYVQSPWWLRLLACLGHWFTGLRLPALA